MQLTPFSIPGSAPLTSVINFVTPRLQIQSEIDDSISVLIVADIHFPGSGSYYYLETSFSRFGDRARLISKVLPVTKNTCFTFWYHMYGKDINTLRILLKKASQQIVVWSRKIQSGLDRWLEGKVALNSDEPFKVQLHCTIEFRLCY